MQTKKLLRTPLKIIPVDKGNVLHAATLSELQEFGIGEVYFSQIIGGETKGWKRHNRMTCNFVVPSGKVQFTIRMESEGRELFLTEILGATPQDYARLQVPPGLWYAFTGLTFPTVASVVCNIASQSHDPLESDTLPLDFFGDCRLGVTD